MNLLILADLHLEFFPGAGRDFLAAIDPAGVDAAVVAGDLCLGSQLYEAAGRLVEKFGVVIYVPGNHEFYRSSFEEVRNTLAKVAQAHVDFHVLDNGILSLGAHRFVGTTLWFRDQAENVWYERFLNDFSQIDRFREHVYIENEKSIRFLEENVDPGDIVITHHLPLEESVVRGFKGFPLNRFFLCDIRALVRDRRPRLFIHGHTHASVDYTFCDTRVICNPFGYYRREENKDFNDRLIVSLD